MQHRRHGNSNIPTELFRSFVAISENGSFTRAAEKLDLTQPAISAQMKRLQQLLGGDLFFKKGQGLGVTEFGSLVESYARRVLTLNDQVIAIAGRAPKSETIHVGIQSVFVRTVLPDVMNNLPATSVGRHRFVCGNAAYLAEKLKSGYVDLAFMLLQTESRRALIAEWPEKIVWMRAPILRLPDDEPVPYISRENGFIDRKILDLFADCDVPYRIVFSAADLWSRAAAAEAGVGILATMERAVPELPDSLILAKDRILPKLPELRGGVFFKEGFDLKRHKALVDAFVSAVQPARVMA
jgi:DNA-binding transcriptional LysR family regulator